MSREIKDNHRFTLRTKSQMLQKIRAQRDAFFNSRDEIENFFLSVSCFETRSRISSLQSHVSRRDREFLPFGLMLRDEIENFCLHSRASRRDREECLKKCTFVERWRPLFSKTSSLVKIVFLNFCFHFCQMSLFNRTLCEEGESESGF